MLALITSSFPSSGLSFLPRSMLTCADRAHQNGSHPYLSIMIRVNRVHGEMQELVSSSPGFGVEDTAERTDFLSYRLQKLVHRIHGSEMFPPDPSTTSPSPPPSAQTAMEAFVTLRITHIRMLSHLKSLSSAETFSRHPESVRELISLAISSVEVHSKMLAEDGERGMIRLVRSTGNKLLMKAVSCMFLAARYNPAVYGTMCRTAFHRGLDILSQLQPSAWYGSDPILSSLHNLRRIGESIQMPALDRPTPHAITPETSEHFPVVENQQMLPEIGDFDFSTPSQIADYDYLASVKEAHTKWEFQIAQVESGQAMSASFADHITF